MTFVVKISRCFGFAGAVVLLLASDGIAGLPTVLDPAKSRVDQPVPQPPGLIRVDNAKQLFVDDWVVSQMDGLKRTLHPVTKHPDNPLFEPERAWEQPAVLLFGTVMFDPHREHDRFRMWYLCFAPEYNADYTERYNKHGRIAYATSRDGLHWERPNLGIHEYKGSKQNNIVIPGSPDSTVIIYDPRDPDPARRYKAQIRNLGHRAYFSPDGIHWTEHGPLGIDGYDRSTVHWDPVGKQWFASTKSWYIRSPGTDPVRGRGYQTTDDFLKWGDAAFMCATPEGSPELVYNLEPFYYETLFLGIWGRYIKDPDALLDVQLAVSRNGKHWERPSDQAWIPLSPLPADFQRKKNFRTPHTGVDPFDPKVPWDYANNTTSSLGPVRVGDELWIYYSGRTSDHKSDPNTGKIGLGTLRLDGFFSLDAGREEGTLTTRPLQLVNEDLRVNADASQGTLEVEILDENGKVIEPFSRQNCVAIDTDHVRHVVSWGDAADLKVLQQKPVRLRFFLKNAELYAFWTGEERRWHTPDTTTW
ncbi:MAG: hypothetical protein MK161_10325 [Pirellulales bacterium]|jgi:hypothetical protein|nr:hypothetical protein [Pirellulales bacterium]